MPDIPLEAPQRAPLWSPSPVVEWLLLDGWRNTETGVLLRAVCERLASGGIPIWRTFCAVPSLHPQYFGEAYVWRRGQPEVDHSYGMWDMLDTESYRNTPIRLILEEGAGGMRRRLVDPETPLDYPVLSDLKEQGATDYVILPMEFSSGQRAAMSFATLDPAGFEKRHLCQLNDLMPVLARLIEAHSLRSTAANLLDVYVGREAGMRILNGEIRRGAAQTIYAAIWYSDLRGFTALSESLPRDRMIAALNAYFEAMTTAVHSQRGEVLKFIGDGMLAIFPVMDGQTPGEACCRAIDAAEAAEEAMANVNEGRAAVGAPILDYGLALHIGEVTYGNIGAADRLDFTVVGPAVNVANRLEQLCKLLDRRPLLSHDFVETCAKSREAECLGRYELRGLTTPHDVYTPVRRG